MWLTGILPIKQIVILLTVVISGIGLHSWFENWKEGLVEKVILEQVQKEVKTLSNEIDRLNVTSQKMQDEVLWARDYVQKQTKTIQILRDKSSIAVQDCLDMYIDSDFIR